MSALHCVHCHADAGPERCASCGEDPRLEGRYALQRVIGQGAAATLYQARDERTGQRVAVKERHPQGVLDEAAERLFRREGEVLRQLDHPRIPAYVDAFASGRGRARRHYLVQELVDGRSLDLVLADTRLDEANVLAIVRELAEILIYLHGLSPPVVHRDLKPSNVVRRADGALVLVDFGAVKDTLSGTLGGATVAGTFGFMAPEQFMGDAVPASDVFALGALAVALLSRRDPAELHDHGRRFEWRRAISVSEGVQDLLAAMLAEDPTDRPTAADLLPRIDALATSQPGVSRKRGRGRKERARRSRRAASDRPSRPSPSDSRAASAPPAPGSVTASASSASALDRLAARGATLRTRRQEQERRARAASDASKALDEAKLADKRLREGLLPPLVAVLPNHQTTLLIGPTAVLTLGGIGVIVVIAGIVGDGLAEVGVPGPLLSLGLLGATAASVIVSMLFWMTAIEAAITAICRVASDRELRRLTRLPLSLSLDAYLDGLSTFRHRGKVQITVTCEVPPSDALAARVRDAMIGAGLGGGVTARGSDLILTSGEQSVVSFHGKRLEHVVSHHAVLHAWTRRVLDRILVPNRRELRIASVAPEVLDG